MPSQKNKNNMSFFSKLFSNKSPQPESNPATSAVVDYQAFFDKAATSDKLRIKSLGNLHLPTGRIVACDPLVWQGAEPFTLKLKPGDYPITVLLHKADVGGERYALAKLEFTKNKPVCWEMAVTKDQDPKQLNDDEIYGYSVDAGLGCFMDIQTYREYAAFEKEFMQKAPKANTWDDYFAPLFKANAEKPKDPHDYGDWLNFTVPKNKQDNVVMFHSGWGDGLYASYWGFDKSGEICSLVTDFQVIGPEE